MSGDEPKKPRRRDRKPANGPESDATDPGSAPSFFLAVCNEGKNHRLYRGYPDPDGISFVHAGPWLWFLDPEIAREVEKASWVTRTLAGLKPGHVVAGGAAVLVVGLLLRLVIGASDADILLLLLGFGAVAAICTILLFGKTLRRIAERVAHLETLSRAELHSEASDGEWNVRAAAETVSNVRIEPDDEAAKGADGDRPSAVLLFRHVSAGKWRLILPSRPDTRAAARAFRRFLEEGEVQVNVNLKNE